MSSSPKSSSNYSNNCCYQQSPYGNSSTGPYSLVPPSLPSAPSHHHHSQLVNNNGQTLSPTSLSMVYGHGQQQPTSSSSPSYGTSLNVLHTLSPTRYQNQQINEKPHNSSTAIIANGQVTSMPVNNVTNSAAALAAASNYRRNYSTCAKPPYRYVCFSHIRVQWSNMLILILILCISAIFHWLQWLFSSQRVVCVLYQKFISSSWIHFHTIDKINRDGKIRFVIRLVSTIVSSKFLEALIGMYQRKKWNECEQFPHVDFDFLFVI